MTVDLHCHTKISDGSTRIDDLICMAKEQGIDTIAVTDHDTFAGSIRAQIFARKLGIEVIPGAEFSGYDYQRKQNVHIVCYLPNNIERLEGLCQRINKIRKQNIILVLQKVMKLYHILPEMVLKKAKGSINIFETHIMHALIDAGYTNSFFGDVYNELFDRRDGSAFVQAEYPDVHHIIDKIHEVQGVAVISHPSLYNNYDLVEELAAKGRIDGIEIWHPKNKSGDEKFFMELAQSYDLLMTGGTDFHGMYVDIPNPLATCTTPVDQLENLRKLKYRKRKAC